MSNFQKLNDLSNSPIKTRFDKKEFVPETNLAVAMGRVSIKKNKDKGNSDVVQLEKIFEYVRANDLKLVREPWDISETAADHEKRKKFHEMIEVVEESQSTSRPIKHVLFAYTSRGSRNKKSKRVIEALMDLGVAVHFIQDHLVLNSSADMASWLTWEVKAIKDQDDVERLKKITWDGTVKRLESGLFPGKAPFGYRNRRERKFGGLSVFVHEKREAEFMVKYFEMFATSLYNQAELLRILAPSFKDIEIPGETKINIHIRNPFYYGSFQYMGQVWNGNPDYHPPLVSYGLWKKVQDVLVSRERGRRDNLDHPYIQLMRCGGRVLDGSNEETGTACVCSITAEDKQKPLKNGGFKKHQYYRCGSRMEKRCSQRSPAFLKANGRKTVSYTEAEVEELFVQIIRPLSFDTERVEWMRSMLLKHHKDLSVAENRKLLVTQARYHQLFQYREKAYEDRLNGVLDSQLWKDRDDKWREEQTGLENEMASLKDNQGLSIKTRGMSDFARIKLRHLNFSERNHSCPRGSLSPVLPGSRFLM